LTRVVQIGDTRVGGSEPLALIAGPCVIETEEITMRTAERVKKLAAAHDLPVIFKSSYLKANRLSVNSYTGPGQEEGLRILSRVKREFELPLLTDVHTTEEVSSAAEVVDALQIPAFLCRQTELVRAAAKTGLPINIKKGQFMAPEDMKFIAEKAESVGNDKVLLTERGTSFGYHNLVVDMRSLVVMRSFGYPVVFDATHSLQLPGRSGGSSGGESQFVIPMARAAVACGVDALFVETHPNVEEALCDKKSMLPLDQLEQLIIDVRKIESSIRGD
jgi:2-dehydro-3-deoxyphosphooctonate aldolase (KDO 8-P synthase)